MSATATGVPVYGKTFGPGQAERLLWRAGFGPRRGEPAQLAKKGLRDAVRSLTRPPAESLSGPEPRADGLPIAPYDAVGHDHLWWLDRMVRTNRPLVERMTLVWHDWFATSNAGIGQQRLLLDQNQLFRTHALGSFSDLLLGVTKDPAMLVWLSGFRNTRFSPNENYARELMELFTLGVNRGYTETDVREQARALTGWRAQRQRDAGYVNFLYDSRLHDSGQKTVFGKTGAYDWQDACRLCLEHSGHPSFFVKELWSYFVPVAPDKKTQVGLEKLYRSSYKIRPVVEAILQHPTLYEGPRMVKPPTVFSAGLLRAIGGQMTTQLWFRVGTLSGQRLFYPPDVSGWNDSRWLDTSTFRGRWFLALLALEPFRGDERTASGASGDPEKLDDRALDFLGRPTLTTETRDQLRRFAKAALPPAKKYGSAPEIVERSLRQLIAVSPDYQTC